MGAGNNDDDDDDDDDDEGGKAAAESASCKERFTNTAAPDDEDDDDGNDNDDDKVDEDEGASGCAEMAADASDCTTGRVMRATLLADGAGLAAWCDADEAGAINNGETDMARKDPADDEDEAPVAASADDEDEAASARRSPSAAEEEDETASVRRGPSAGDDEEEATSGRRGPSAAENMEWKRWGMNKTETSTRKQPANERTSVPNRQQAKNIFELNAITLEESVNHGRKNTPKVTLGETRWLCLHA
jgi:hypothetical protein